ncbi:MAG: SurA N-terminal domain-containing protein [Gemmatimonadales bacterium]
MQAFRSAAKPVLAILALTFLIWLVWDLSGLGSGTGNVFTRTTVGRINGRKVDVRVFDQRVQNVIAEQQQRGANVGLDQVDQIRNQVWEQMVQEYLLQGEYRRLGLRVTDDEVADAIRNVPPPEAQQLPQFQTNGQFDLDKYQRWLRSAEGQAFVPALEYQYRDQLLQAKLFRSVVADVFLSDATLWERYRDEREQVKIGMVRIDPITAVNDPAAPIPEAEAQAYYQQHRDEFKRAKTAFLSYLTVPRLPVASDTAAARARIQALKEEITKGTPFEEVATRESSDSVSAARGGDLGEAKRSDFDSLFSDAAMRLPLNTVSDPVLTSFGYHLIKVETRKGDTFKARHLLVPIEVTGAHRDQLDAMADSLETLAAEKLEPEAIDTAANALGLTVKAAPPVTQGNRVIVQEGGVVPDAAVWAFQAEVGEHSTVIEAPTAFFVFRLDSLHQEGVPSFAAVKTEVENRIRMDKKAVEARRLGESLIKQVTAAKPLRNAATTMGFEYRELGPFARLSAPLGAPTLIGAAFGTRPGQIVGPVEADQPVEKGTPADRGVYLFEMIERTPADSAEFARSLSGIRSQAIQAARRSRVQAYMASLKESAKLVDKRGEIYKTAAQNAALQAQSGIPIG